MRRRKSSESSKAFQLEQFIVAVTELPYQVNIVDHYVYVRKAGDSPSTNMYSHGQILTTLELHQSPSADEQLNS